MGLHRNFSEETARMIDEEIKRIVDEAQVRADSIIKKNIDKLHLLAKTLLEKEIMSGDEIERLINPDKSDHPA